MELGYQPHKQLREELTRRREQRVQSPESWNELSVLGGRAGKECTPGLSEREP